MAILVDLQVVPNRIFEVVKARILANRAKFAKNQKLQESLRPKAKQRLHQSQVGETYRLPEPAATGNAAFKLYAAYHSFNSIRAVSSGKTLTAPLGYTPGDTFYNQLIANIANLAPVYGPDQLITNKSSIPYKNQNPNGWTGTLDVLDSPDAVYPSFNSASFNNNGFFEAVVSVQKPGTLIALLPWSGDIGVLISFKSHTSSYARITHTNSSVTVAGKKELYHQRDLRCFLISTDDVKELTPPTELNSCFERLFPSSPNFITASLNLKNTIIEPGQTTTQLVPLNLKIPIPEFLGLHGDILDFRKDPENNFLYSPHVLLQQYGIGTLSESPHNSSVSSFWSPAAFTLLKEYTGDIDSFDNSISYGYIAQQYKFASPGYLDIQSPDRVNGGTLSAKLSIKRPLNFITAVSPASLGYLPTKKLSIAGIDIANAYDYTLLVASDWANPSYCRQQLLSLGFKAEDLTFSS